MSPKLTQPLTDEQVWGEPESKTKQACGEPVESNCSLKIDGQCPEGCCECAKFAHELIFGCFGFCED